MSEPIVQFSKNMEFVPVKLIKHGVEVFRLSANGRVICESVDVTDDKDKCYDLLMQLCAIIAEYHQKAGA